MVRDENGQLAHLRPQDILPRVEIFGQHEISELTRSSEKRTLLLHRFIDRDESLDRRKASVRRSLAQTRRSILDVQSELRQIEAPLATLPALEETLVRHQDAGREDRLRERSLLVREERVLASMPDRVQTFRGSLNALREELPVDLVFLSPGALEDLPGRGILADAEPVLERLSADLEQVAKLLGKHSSAPTKESRTFKVGGRHGSRKSKSSVRIYCAPCRSRQWMDRNLSACGAKSRDSGLGRSIALCGSGRKSNLQTGTLSC